MCSAFSSIDIDNPFEWLTNNSEFVEYVLKGNVKQSVEKLNFINSAKQYPDRKRSCSTNMFFKNRLNGEKIQRTWILYSESLGKIFCFYCKLFANKPGHFSCDGFDDWKQPNRIAEHEVSKDHCQAAFVFAKRSEDARSIKSDVQKQTVNEVNYIGVKFWREYSVLSVSFLHVVCHYVVRMKFLEIFTTETIWELWNCYLNTIHFFDLILNERLTKEREQCLIYLRPLRMSSSPS